MTPATPGQTLEVLEDLLSSDLRMEDWPIGRLRPYAGNPRNNDDAVPQMMASIREFGFPVPVLARSDGMVIDGHLRLKAAQRLALPTVPVVICDQWTDAQVKAFRLLVNRSVGWADWDQELLAQEVADLEEVGFDLDLTGFDEQELGTLLAMGGSDPGTDEDAMPTVPDAPVSESGDLWILGPHRLLCGDATSETDVARLLGDHRPDLMVSDPPYGVGYDPAWRESALGRSKRGRSVGKVEADHVADWRAAYALFGGDVAYVWHAGTQAHVVAQGLEECGFQIRSQIIWVKQHFVISRGHYHLQHEPCWYAVQKGRTGHWVGDRKQSTLWQIANRSAFGGQNDDASTPHGTQKPVECMRRPILNHTKPSRGVYDPFVGSGTTIIAAQTTGRVCYGIDIDPIYVDVAVRRWQDFTATQATLEGDGRTFAEMTKARMINP